MSTCEDAGIIFGPIYVCPECKVTLCQNSKDLENWEIPTPCWACQDEIDRKEKDEQSKPDKA